MDPNATLTILEHFLSPATRDYAEARRLRASLVEWLFRGGFLPNRDVRIACPRAMRYAKCSYRLRNADAEEH